MMPWERNKAKRLKIHQKGGGDIQGRRAQAVPAKADTNLQAWKTPFRSTWHSQTAVIQGSEEFPSTPAPLSLGSSLCHNELTSVAEWGGSGGWMAGEVLSQAGWALLFPKFNIHVLHHLGVCWSSHLPQRE